MLPFVLLDLPFCNIYNTSSTNVIADKYTSTYTPYRTIIKKIELKATEMLHIELEKTGRSLFSTVIKG